MSTRALIAVPGRGGVFHGRYHHFDGYPSGLGRELCKLYVDLFDQNIDAMRQLLFYDHPAGWSNIIGVDWTLPIGYKSFSSVGREKPPPMCYCHGDRAEGPHPPIRPGDTTDTEYCYVLGDIDMAILAQSWNSRGVWRHVDAVPWDIGYNGTDREWGYLDRYARVIAQFSSKEVLR